MPHVFLDIQDEVRHPDHTLVKDATAAFSQEAMHAAHAINGPYAHAIVTTEELIPQLSA
jgi:hypothetical protein